MAVKIRLKRLGKIRAPYYRIVVADSRTKRDGRVIEEIGKYHPTEDPSFMEVQSDRAQYWLGVGAQPSPQVKAILKLTGDWGIFKGDKDAKSTVKAKEAKVEFQADEKKKPVLKPKAERPVAKVEEPKAAEPTAAEPTVEEPTADVEAPAAAVEAVVVEAAAETAVSDVAADEAPADEVAVAVVAAPAEEAADAVADAEADKA